MINWKVRFKNPVFWMQVMTAIVIPVFGYYGITGANLTTWAAVGKLILDALSNPYVLFIAASGVWNAINDPTTRGIGDSAQAQTYTEPK